MSDTFDSQNDCLKIFFGLQKNDQDGTRNMDPRHCYANPFNPEISIVLSLAIYFLCFGINNDRSERLFEGKQQYQRFLKALKNVMTSCREINVEMKRCGLTVEDIAAHSTRKGGRSYCAGGSTNGPAFVTIMLRGGWSLEGIDKRYVRYERAGDQYVGRILSGLNVNTPEFAFLPPFFWALPEMKKMTVHGGRPKNRSKKISVWLSHNDILGNRCTREMCWRRIRGKLILWFRILLIIGFIRNLMHFEEVWFLKLMEMTLTC